MRTMSSIILYHHLDLGDAIICNGLVREYAKKYDRVAVFTKPNNLVSVTFMYRDLPNVEIIPGDADFAKMFISLNFLRLGKFHYDKAKIIGYPYIDQNSGETFEQQFYRAAGVDFEKKWGSFYFERDRAGEQVLFDKATPKGDYIFVHDDAPRNFPIDPEKLPKNYPVVFPKKEFTSNVFDYCMLLEKAKEIHVIDSSFMFLVDNLTYENPGQKLVVHRYSRPNFVWSLPILRKNWEILL